MTPLAATLAGTPMPILAMLSLPFLAALAVRPLAVISPRVAGWLGPLTLLSCALLGLWLLSVAGDQPMLIALGSTGASLELLLKVDRLALVLALVSLALVLLSWTRREDHPDPARTRAALLLLAGGLVGLALAGDPVTSWLFLEVCAMAGGALLLIGGTLRSLTAMLAFVRWSAIGSGLAVVGLGLTLTAGSLANGNPAADTLGRLGFGLLVLGFGVKVALFPLNAWMAPAGRAAGARVLALLTGVLPALALVNLSRQLTTGGAVAQGADVLMLLGMLSALAGALGMWRAREFPTFLIGLSLASMGAVAVGFSLPWPAGPFSALALLLHFLLVHSALFVLAHRWRRRHADLAGIAWRLPLTAAVLMLLAASLVGVPPLPGFWAKLMLVLSLAEYGGSAALMVLLILLLSTAVEAVAWLRLLRQLYARTDNDGFGTSAPDGTAGGLMRADRLAQLLVPSRWARAYGLLVAALLLLVTLSIASVTEGLNRLVVPSGAVAEPRLAVDGGVALWREVEQ
ncbi:proton-conducting transporter transmembrane domain-containing protein [Thiorhodovibrio frisius]|uniref:Formate hydrogenlyase subunit 3/multisubunit Na+/H+ antiporter, MnhD subunit n=1 Tax=Thiorhodovibrio frisius TaxID=631362 RepID=H8Z3U3_9GAMM|nr:proton-conducting transporter membrane subunit [Thiorhodovibrio frisius]EIC21095.1 formate hydrogenlyase subunit 3/multisubunit Na+/H+ antiporter, MnhD subunit [Thiorhodovibrio frisius]WPL22156.1 Mrp complex subunit D1 [Thiorhodovibrio frisius]